MAASFFGWAVQVTKTARCSASTFQALAPYAVIRLFLAQ